MTPKVHFPLFIMYGVKLLIVVLQELQCLPDCLQVRVSITSTSFVAKVSEIAKCIA